MCRTTVGSLMIGADVGPGSESKELTLEELKSKVGQHKRVHGGIDLLLGLEPVAVPETKNKSERSVKVAVTEEGELNWLNHVHKGLWFFDGPTWQRYWLIQ